MRLGHYPTPVDRHDDALGPPGATRPLWVKRDDLTAALYGGNKVRKLERLLDDARRAGVRRLVTVGGAGSHHVLATVLYAGTLGIDVEAVLVPQPRSLHVAQNLRAIAGRARVWPARSFVHAGAIVVDRIACGAHYVPPGGSTRASTRAYAAAARELMAQVGRGELPRPEVVVVTLGSGGTAAGLAAGFARVGAPVRVVGVLVSEPEMLVTAATRRLAAGCALEGRGGVAASDVRLAIDTGHVGDGYGHPTAEGERATLAAARLGLTLDPTYTAKTFAAVLALPPLDGPVLYWHTLSSAPMAPLLEGMPGEDELPADVRALLERERTPT